MDRDWHFDTRSTELSGQGLTAIRTARWGREVECLFVEKDAKTDKNLCSTLAD